MTILTVIILIAVVGLIVIVISLYRFTIDRFENLSERLTRMEDALGSEDWVEFLRDAGINRDDLEQEGIAGRLERIEAALDPMARARLDVKRLKRQMDEALQEDPGSGYAHWQVTKIEELIEKGEKPERNDWESWIGTPFPWG